MVPPVPANPLTAALPMLLQGIGGQAAPAGPSFADSQTSVGGLTVPPYPFAPTAYGVDGPTQSPLVNQILTGVIVALSVGLVVSIVQRRK